MEWTIIVGNVLHAVKSSGKRLEKQLKSYIPSGGAHMSDIIFKLYVQNITLMYTVHAK